MASENAPASKHENQSVEDRFSEAITHRAARHFIGVDSVSASHWYRRSMPYTKRAMSQIIYPDVSNILARKKEGRREISRRSLGEKIAMVEAMRERLAPLKRIRGATCKSEIRRAELVLPRTKNLFAWIRDNTGTGHGV
jgi:hypothetical protein